MVDQPDRRPNPAPSDAGGTAAVAPSRRPRAVTAGARRYARALLDVALLAEDPAKLREELDAAATLLEGNTELATVLAHPAVSADKKKAIVEAVWSRGGSTPLFRKLMAVLADNGRLGYLPAIATAYAALWNEQRGTLEAEAITAVPLDQTAASALRLALEKASGKDVELTSRIDPSILGGVRVTMGGRTYDGTVKARLHALRERLAGRAEGTAAS